MTPTRSDAQRNRERILAVAYDALAADPGTSLNTVAKLAGVGPGTLYRHFPTREELILTLYRQEVQALAGQVPAVLAGHEPVEADVLLVMGFLWRVPPGEEGLRQADRILELVLAGLRPGT